MKYRIIQYYNHFTVQREYKEKKYSNIIYEIFGIFGKEYQVWKKLDERGLKYISIIQNMPKKYSSESEAIEAIKAFKFNENPKIINV